MANDLFDSLRTYINKVSVNEKSAAEIANSVNAWVREKKLLQRSRLRRNLHLRSQQLRRVQPRR
jgi:hypothetical protein